MSEAISLRIHGGIAKVSATGVELVPWFSRTGVLIEWCNVMCVSPIPFTAKFDGQWKTFRDESVTLASLQAKLRFYALQVGISDRQQVLAKASLLTRAWLVLSVWLKPLYEAEDKPHRQHGCVELSLRKWWVRRNAQSLLSALDLMERHAKFDHMGSW